MFCKSSILYSLSASLTAKLLFQTYLKLICNQVCESLPIVENAQMIVVSLQQNTPDNYLSGTEVMYTCDEGYEIVQPSTTCGLDGKWSDVVFCYPSLYLCILFTSILQLKAVDKTDLIKHAVLILYIVVSLRIKKTYFIRLNSKNYFFYERFTQIK